MVRTGMVLVLALSSSLLQAGDPPNAKEALQQIVQGAKTNTAKAAAVMAAAQKLTDEPELQQWLFERSYELGLASQVSEGYSIAEKAILSLAQVNPEKRDYCRQKLRSLYEACSRGVVTERREAALKLAQLAEEDAADAERAGDWAKADVLYKQTAAVLRSNRLDGAAAMDVRAKYATHRIDVQAAQERLEAETAAKPSDVAPLESLVHLHLLDKGDAGSAAKLLKPSCSEILRTMVPLAATDPSKLEAGSFGELAGWYLSLSRTSKGVARAVCLLRAKDCCAAFLAKYPRQDLARLKAQEQEKEIAQEIVKCDAVTMDVARMVMAGTTGQKRIGGSFATTCELDEDVKAALRKGAEYLLSQQKAEGQWPSLGNKYPVGHAALAVAALLQSGMSVDSPRMKKALSYLGDQKTTKTYELGLRCQAWMLAEKQAPRSCQLRLQSDLKQLLTTTNGSYTYDCIPGSTAIGCNSNTQFGQWGVYCAVKSGLSVPAAYWDKALLHWQKSQATDGCWNYRSSETTGTATMTAAGLASSYQCINCLPPGTRKMPDLKIPEKKLGLFLQERDAMPTNSTRLNRGIGDNYYLLFTIARAGEAAHLQKLGDADWYALGKEMILKPQRRGVTGITKEPQLSDGSWSGSFGPVVSTSLAMLFLTQGRSVGNLLADLRPSDLPEAEPAVAKPPVPPVPQPVRPRLPKG